MPGADSILQKTSAAAGNGADELSMCIYINGSLFFFLHQMLFALSQKIPPPGHMAGTSGDRACCEKGGEEYKGEGDGKPSGIH